MVEKLSFFRSVSELARGELCSIALRLITCAIEKIIDMAICYTLSVSDWPSSPDYLILIDDIFCKTKMKK